jgi:DNA invertase Pin-like site-specific DNA recombinase
VHLCRLALVYVRQSSPHQVLTHRESRARQYALAEHAVALGWPRERVIVIDDDQGQSSQTPAARSGFHRLLAEVTMEHVGLVLGLEMSRLARSSEEWHHLLQLCALFGTILADEDGVYDPHDCNDRLLLGLKGTISEFELVTMRNRLERGRLNKAQRGALFHRLPIGYVKVSSERIDLDPDEQVRAIVRLIFDKYDEFGSVRGVLNYLLRHHICLGIRPDCGPQRGQLQWRRPCLPTLHQVLRHPLYAGAYVHGRYKRTRVAGRARPTVQLLPMSQWQVLKRDCLPAYITWERYLANRERLQQRRTSATGTPRSGVALLTGLVVCGRCGWRLQPTYHGNKVAYYHCPRHRYEMVEQSCYGLQARAIDDLVAQQLLQALQPAAVELSLKALEDIEGERARLDQHWQQRRERARYEAQDAERRYRAVDPENRLVARTLEQGWEEALHVVRQTDEDYDRFLQGKPLRLSAAERSRIQALASDIPALWHAAATTAKDRKEIVRLLVQRVVVHVCRDSEYVDVTLCWHGGSTSQHTIVRPVESYSRLRDYQRLLERLVQLRRTWHSAEQIAEVLNQEGFRPPRQCRDGFCPEMVRQLLCRCGLTQEQIGKGRHSGDEWWMPDLAKAIPVAAATLRHWVLKGWVHARKTPSQTMWILWADSRELQRLRQMAALLRAGAKRYPAKLRTPRKKPRG